MLVALNRKQIHEDLLEKKYDGQDIVISIDSSKTNTGICVRNKFYQVVDVIEIIGADDKDVLKLCDSQRKFLRRLLAGANVIDAGIEDIITKKGEGQEYHHSRFKITAVFMNIIFTLQEFCNITPQLISNQAWKHVVLPPELNKRSIYKGSVDFIRGKYPHLIVGVKDDDIADAICIGEFMRISKGIEDSFNIIVLPDYKEVSKVDCEYRLYSIDSPIDKTKLQEFKLSDKKSIEDNIVSMANNLNKKKVGYAIIEAKNIPIDFLYEYSRGPFREYEKEVYIVVARK